jgi:hypothetical protein
MSDKQLDVHWKTGRVRLELTNSLTVDKKEEKKSRSRSMSATTQWWMVACFNDEQLYPDKENGFGLGT